MSRFTSALAGFMFTSFALTAAQAAKPERGVEPGIYGNVRYYEESGDVSGMEIAVHAGEARLVETTICDGAGCDPIIWSRYEQRGGWVEYEYRESPDTIIIYRIKQDGRNVRVEEIREGFVTRRKLTRLKQRMGLSIADDNKAKRLETEGLASIKSERR
ncbi:hypothetical protein [Rhizorhabdus dicambivorans]|uniref:DUF995 domain-containing protein n=1 Tax=Rhizorhabdus dicambivorans TaxID=1850238 RepID=A0A2A4FST2_9SPHN|nr:hypothetical protein [Rhizorhabdus dicambivorans]ATE67011.1 hypothetical protein CMV14_23555 [Rhizorhabdus dicambivorans]PCE40508.1 hypothetical protein COO09_20075 [Rhizorhabdus dicambivorans]